MPEGNTEKAGSPESGDPHSGPAPLWTAPRLEERGHEVSLLNEWSGRGAGALSRTSGSSLARAISVSFTPPAHCSDFWNCHVSLERDSCYLWSNKSGDMSVCSAGSISMAGVRVGLRSRTHRHVWLWRSGFIYSGKRGGGMVTGGVLIQSTEKENRDYEELEVWSGLSTGWLQVEEETLIPDEDVLPRKRGWRKRGRLVGGIQAR